MIIPHITDETVLVLVSGVYFIKKQPLAVPKEDCSDFLIVGDLATRSIDQLSSLVDEVFVPLLSNEDNHNGWPEMVAQDVQKHVHNLKSTVYQVRSHLPLFSIPQ